MKNNQVAEDGTDTPTRCSRDVGAGIMKFQWSLWHRIVRIFIIWNFNGDFLKSKDNKTWRCGTFRLNGKKSVRTYQLSGFRSVGSWIFTEEHAVGCCFVICLDSWQNVYICPWVSTAHPSVQPKLLWTTKLKFPFICISFRYSQSKFFFNPVKPCDALHVIF